MANMHIISVNINDMGGKITIEESAGLFAIGGGLQVKNYADVMAMETMELVQRIYSDTITGRTSIGAFCRPVTLA